MFFGIFGVLCFLETPVLTFAFCLIIDEIKICFSKIMLALKLNSEQSQVESWVQGRQVKVVFVFQRVVANDQLKEEINKKYVFLTFAVEKGN